MDRRRLLRLLLAAGAAGACARTGVEPTTPPGAPVAGSPPSSPITSPSASPAPSPPSSAAPEPIPATLPPVPGAVVAVLCRDAWGAAPPTGPFRPHTVERLTVHHTASVLGDNRRAPARLRQHQRFHQQEAGWPDIAYHHAVDRGGNVYELRPTDAAGDTFTDYDPAGHYLLVAEGNFDEEQPSEEQLDALARMLAWASSAFGVPLDTVSGHRDHAATACPGDALYAALGDLRARAAAYGGVTSTPDCGPEGAARVAAIERGA